MFNTPIQLEKYIVNWTVSVKCLAFSATLDIQYLFLYFWFQTLTQISPPFYSNFLLNTITSAAIYVSCHFVLGRYAKLNTSLNSRLYLDQRQNSPQDFRQLPAGWEKEASWRELVFVSRELHLHHIMLCLGIVFQSQPKRWPKSRKITGFWKFVFQPWGPTENIDFNLLWLLKVLVHFESPEIMKEKWKYNGFPHFSLSTG